MKKQHPFHRWLTRLAVLCALLALMLSISAVACAVTGDEIVDYAKQWIGKIPYELDYGGHQVDVSELTTTDCSGFICGVYYHFGINLWPNKGALRNSPLVHDIGTTDYWQAEKGDIIYWEKRSADSYGHVALYAGNGEIVEETTSGNTRNVRVSQVSYMTEGANWPIKGIYRANDVTSIVDLGSSFDAHIIFKHPWRLAIVNSANNNVEIGDELRRAVEDWHFERQSDGSYIISSFYNGYVLDVDGAINENATNVQVYQRWGEDNTAQKWFIHTCSDGYRLTPKLAPYRSFDASGGDFATGRNIHIYDNNTTDAQVVWFYKLDYTPPTSVSVLEVVTLSVTDVYSLRVNYYGTSEVSLSCTGMYFSSSNPEVATVNGNGDIQALNPGTTTIRATSAYSDRIYDECVVTVNLPVSPDSPTLPTNLQSIEEEAFEGSRLSVISIPEGCVSLGDRAFASSSARFIYIPDSVTTFGQNLFENCSTYLTIFCHSGSAAEAYAISNNINYYLLAR